METDNNVSKNSDFIQLPANNDEIEALIEAKKGELEKLNQLKNGKTRLKEPNDFSNEEIETMIEEFNNTPFAIKELDNKFYNFSKKYNTSEDTIRRIVVSPNDVSNHPDFPKKSKNVSNEEYERRIEEYYGNYGLRQQKDFSEDEKKSVIDDSTIELIGPRALSKKYNTSTFVIRRIVLEAGLALAPGSNFPYLRLFPVKLVT